MSRYPPGHIPLGAALSSPADSLDWRSRRPASWPHFGRQRHIDYRRPGVHLPAPLLKKTGRSRHIARGHAAHCRGTGLLCRRNHQLDDCRTAPARLIARCLPGQQAQQIHPGSHHAPHSRSSAGSFRLEAVLALTSPHRHDTIPHVLSWRCRDSGGSHRLQNGWGVAQRGPRWVRLPYASAVPSSIILE